MSSNRLGSHQVQVKVTGDKQSVDDFNAVINNIFRLAAFSNVKQKYKDSGVHCFINIDPNSIARRNLH